MTTFVALLRAINVGGQNKVPMADLRRLLEGLGLRNVRTHLRSGNVVFDVEAGGGRAAAAQELAAAIEARIARDLGPRVSVAVMSAAACAAVADADPFAGAGETAARIDPGWLHVTFLFGAAGDAASGLGPDVASSAAFEAEFGKLDLPAQGGERAVLVGVPPLDVPVVYLCLPHGYGRTKLNNSYFERHLGAVATTRNWRTVLALAEMSAG